jgi:hypothetical protein
MSFEFGEGCDFGKTEVEIDLKYMFFILAKNGITQWSESISSLWIRSKSPPYDFGYNKKVVVETGGWMLWGKKRDSPNFSENIWLTLGEMVYLTKIAPVSPHQHSLVRRLNFFCGMQTLEL